MAKAAETSGCIFCEKPAQNKDEENYIFHRGKHCFALLNLFPYNSGHFMVAPYRHVANLEDLTEEETLELWKIVSIGIKILRETMNPHGFNVGINIGRTAGAGYEGHIHVHVVPRWNGDTNFMPVLADTKVIPEHLAVTYKRLKEGFERALGGGEG